MLLRRLLRRMLLLSVNFMQTCILSLLVLLLRCSCLLLYRLLSYCCVLLRCCKGYCIATTCYVLLRCYMLLYCIWYIYMLLLIGRVGVVRVGCAREW